MPRSLPNDLIENPGFQTFIANVIRDPELSPEIRDGSVTIYYRGDALIRELGVWNGQISGKVHFKYIPVAPPNGGDYYPLLLGDAGLALPQHVAPIPVGFGDPGVLAAYKRVMKSVSRGAESVIVHEIVCHPDNCILDQEIQFQVPGDAAGDKIDICHFDTHLNCLSFVEVKGIHDSRIVPSGDGLPEVVDQLIRYGNRISAQRDVILEDYQRVLSLKERLGLAPRLVGVPTDGFNSLLMKPVLVIGNCTQSVVDAITNREEQWGPLMDGLQEFAAGLILCGSAGCRLNLRPRQQVIVFDTTTI